MDLASLLDEIASTRSSWAHREASLKAIEQHMATICGSNGSLHDLGAFILQQDAFESNVASRLVASLASWLASLQTSLNDARDSKISSQPEELATIMHSLSILQGVSLMHGPSKAFLARSWCLQLFLDLISSSKYLELGSVSLEAAVLPDDHFLPPTNNLASSTLDTLLCVLVDDPRATRSFEAVGGLDVVVRTLKRQAVARDVRMKCLEFLYFYLLPEETKLPTSANGSASVDDFSPPKPGYPFTSTPPPSRTRVSSDIASEETLENDGTFAPNPKVAELKMLRGDMDFVPSTPIKKTKAANLGLGSPLRSRPDSSPLSTPIKSRKRDMNMGEEGFSSSSSVDTKLVPLEPKTPRKDHSRARSEAALRQDIGRTSLEIGRGSVETLLRTPTKSSRPTLVTSARRKNGSDDENMAQFRVPRRLHTRGSSIAGATLVGSPVTGTFVNKPGALVKPNASMQNNPIRSTEEKRELLSNYLGNVNALMDGMKRAGAWGLG